MVNYKRIEYKNAANDTGFRYLKNTKLTKESRIPHEVMEKFQYTSDVEYDEDPHKRRCIACDAPQSRQRYLNQKSVDLCEWHYQNMRLGQIAQVIREAEEAAGRPKEPVKKTKKKTKKTILSSMVWGDHCFYFQILLRWNSN